MIDESKELFLKEGGITSEEGGTIGIGVEGMLYLFAGACKSAEDLKYEVVKEKPFLKVTPPPTIKNGEQLVQRLNEYIETLTRILTYELPMLTMEIQNYTPEEMNRILEDVKQEMRDFTTYRMFEVTRNSLRNTDDLVELPLVVAGLGKKIAEETISIQTSGYSVAKFVKGPEIQSNLAKLKGASNVKEAYERVKGKIPEPFKLGIPSFAKTATLPTLGGWGYGGTNEQPPAKEEQS